MECRSKTLAEIVMSRCDELGRCSLEPERITRLFLSDAMRAAHQQLFAWTEQAGMTSRVDNLGNFVARLSSARGNKVLLLGSHLDSVPGAGRYDGVLGTLVSIAVCQRLGKASLPFHVDVIGMSEEEGVRFQRPYLGSSALVGTFDTNWLDRTDTDGVTMQQAIRTFGLAPEAIDECRYQLSDVIGYIEPHIEQGPVLERLGRPVGVVSGIAGQSRLRLGFTGQAGHAGTAPMTGRRDALLAAARFICEVRSDAMRTEGLKATVGSMRVEPNTPNVIAGRAELTLDVRHLDDDCRIATTERLLTAGNQIADEEHATFEVLEQHGQPSVRCDARLVAKLAEAVAEVNGPPVELESGAGHDAVILGQHMPMAMLFLRHPGGVSHHPDERVETEDVAIAIEVLARCVLKLADDF